MIKKICLWALVFAVFLCKAQGQRVEDAISQDAKSLQNRFDIMKEESETYSQYKVIRLNILNSFWKMSLDSINEQKKMVTDARASIAKLEGQLSTVDEVIKKKDETIEEMAHEASTINVLGIDIQKNVFLTMITVITVALLVLAGLLFARLKLIRSAVKEKTETANLLSREFEEYKRKALDKQMKLSRELQTERNRIQELRN